MATLLVDCLGLILAVILFYLFARFLDFIHFRYILFDRRRQYNRMVAYRKQLAEEEERQARWQAKRQAAAQPPAPPDNSEENI